MKFNRIWAMPDKSTFNIDPINELVKRYLANSKVSIDPFARNKRWATYTNDLNPKTGAEYHLEAIDFLQMLLDQKVKADLILFDPPYSIPQAKEEYEGYGPKSYTHKWNKEKDIISRLLNASGYFIHFGWHSNGLGKKHHAEIEEILLVPHGSMHYDTIVTVEKKIAYQTMIEGCD